MRAEEKALFNFLETELVGERIRKRSVRKTQKSIDKIDKEIYLAQKPVKFNYGQNFFFKHAMTAIIAVIVCLSIVLPITLPRNGGALTPIDPDIPSQPRIYSNDIIRFPISESNLRGIPGLLLLGEHQIPPLFGVIPMWGTSSMELANDAPLLLSYTVEGSWVTLDNGDRFMANQRIRTHRYYHFANYLSGFYSALEIAYNLHADEVVENGIQKFDIDEEVILDDIVLWSRTTAVSAFIVDDMPIFAHANYTEDESFNMVRTAVIFFQFGGNDYFIRITEIYGEEVSTSLDDMIEYVKDTVVPALFENIVVNSEIVGI